MRPQAVEDRQCACAGDSRPLNWLVLGHAAPVFPFHGPWNNAGMPRRHPHVTRQATETQRAFIVAPVLNENTSRLGLLGAAGWRLRRRDRRVQFSFSRGYFCASRVSMEAPCRLDVPLGRASTWNAGAASQQALSTSYSVLEESFRLHRSSFSSSRNRRAIPVQD